MAGAKRAGAHRTETLAALPCVATERSVGALACQRRCGRRGRRGGPARELSLLPQNGPAGTLPGMRPHRPMPGPPPLRRPPLRGPLAVRPVP
eukprot:293811-Chlamydomonas_euryale.AAC.13